MFLVFLGHWGKGQLGTPRSDPPSFGRWGWGSTRNGNDCSKPNCCSSSKVVFGFSFLFFFFVRRHSFQFFTYFSVI